MSKSDEYRANAQECQHMAGISRNPDEKAVWQRMAEDWLRMFLGACPTNRCSNPSESDSSLDYEQALSPPSCPRTTSRGLSLGWCGRAWISR
jgi:hypothetical protein